MTQTLHVDTLLAQLADRLKKILTERQISRPALVGVRTGGVWIAQYLQRTLGIDEPLGELDISFYRDDFTRIGLNPSVRPSSLPFETEGRDIILVDDVVMSGRTVRAAMNELFDYGRPASIVLVALVDLPHRELPVQPDASGTVLTLSPGERVKLTGPDPLRLEIRGPAGVATKEGV